MLMIESSHNLFLDMGKIEDHPIPIQILSPAMNRDDPIMAVNILTLAFVVQTKPMASGNFKGLFQIVHQGSFSAFDLL